MDCFKASFMYAAYASTFAGNGSTGYADGFGASAMIILPTGIAVDSHGNLYVGDSANALRKISIAG